MKELDFLLCALLGWIVSVALKQRSLQEKARVSNVKYKWTEYFTDDFWSIVATFAFIAICIIASRRAEWWSPDEFDFAFIGYAGSDIALRFFSRSNNKLNAAIDHKTDIADEQSGTLGAPTPK